jgi:thiosulfate/3-mercaptopyruvate sulfurtransferase
MFTTLISAENLLAHLNDPHWVIFDCRHDLARPEAGRQAFQEGHLPGAHFAHLDLDLAGPKNGTNGRHPLPDRQRFIAFLRTHGVDDSTQIIAYDASGGPYAARLWWLTRWIGHEAAAVLDGGLPAWSALGLPLARNASDGPSGSITLRATRVVALGANEILTHLEDGTQTIVDARAGERFRGEVEPLDPVAGHIPHARNRPYGSNLDAHGRFKPGATLRAEFQALLGAARPETVVHQCGSGVTACHNLLAMEVAGLHGAALYPGSWSEWCSDPARPIARGPD